MSPSNARSYPFGYGPSELKRLGIQHRAWEENNRQLLARAGFREGDTLVDLGCGPGFTTLDLARIAGPTGRVIGVDRDGDRSIPQMLRRAERAGLENIEARAADLADFDLPIESVDGVYGRWVLMYVPEREVEALVARLAGWLRPGGSCALAEFCNFSHIHIHPPTASLAPVAEALRRAAAGSPGSNPEIGNALPGLLERAGLQVELRVVTKAIRATTPDWSWPDTLFRQILPPLVDEGLLAGEVLARFLAEWADRSANPAAVFFSSPVMEAIGRRARE
jgi:ubiquinone/menaquinone biosynthesis C-methylase UbiE